MWHCQPWCEHLEPPDLLDLDDTDEEVDAELQSHLNPQSGEGEGDGVGWPIVPITPNLGLGLFMRPGLVPGMMAQCHAWEPPIIQQQLGALLHT